MPFIDANEYNTHFPAPMTFLVDDLLIPEGSLLIFGQPGAMKSWLAMQLAYCIASGQPFVGLDTVQLRVALVNFEISEHAYHWRSIDMGSHFELPEQSLFINTLNMLFLDEENNLNYFAELLDPIAPRVIILDCMSCFFGGDENSGEQVGRLYYNLKRVAQVYQAALVLVHHDNKNIFATGLAAVRGSTRIIGYVDSVIKIVPQPTCRQIQFLKNRHLRRAEAPRPFNVFFENYLWVRHDH